MADRYVRVQSEGKICYGLLEINLSVQVLTDAPWLDGKKSGTILPPESYTLLSPCNPSKIVGVGKNYLAHAQEMSSDVSQEPIIFLKAITALLPHQGTILLPSQAQRVDYEGELAIIIGSPCFDKEPRHALASIWGYTIANDVTARDLQRQDGQWTRSKSFDSFCPLGPWIVRDISPTALLQTFVKDAPLPVQSVTIDEMVFAPELIVSFISRVMTLLPGDVILTGTPAGVGKLTAGDVIAVEIEGIGRLQNTVAQRPVTASEEEDL